MYFFYYSMPYKKKYECDKCDAEEGTELVCAYFEIPEFTPEKININQGTSGGNNNNNNTNTNSKPNESQQQETDSGSIFTTILFALVLLFFFFF